MKNEGPLEKVIESEMVDYAKKHQILCYKFTSPSRRSVPDRLFILPNGRGCFFAEIKRKGKKPTPSQAVEIDKIKRQGISVFVVDDVASGRVAVDAMMHDPLSDF